MKLEFNSAVLKDALTELSMPRQIGFMLLLCERMAPALRKFSADVGLEISVYFDCLEAGWGLLEGRRVDSQTAHKLSENVMKVAPDTESYVHELTSAALNAVLCASLEVEFLAHGNLDRVVEGAGLACETIKSYLQLTKSSSPIGLSMENLACDPLMQRELRCQANDLLDLECLATDQHLVPFLKERARRASSVIPVPEGYGRQG